MIDLPAMQLDRTSPIPLYYQIATQLQGAIESGHYAPGISIPSEIEMSGALNVSRPTVRQAVQQLTQLGLVVRRRGIGTVVSPPRIHRPATLSSLYDALQISGRKPSSRTIRVEVRPAMNDLAVMLGIDTGTHVIVIERIRLADGLALALMENTIPLELLPDIPTKTQLDQQGLYALMRAQGIRFHSATQEIGARTISSREAKLLNAARNETVLTMRRTARDSDQVAVEIGRHVYLAEHYTFDMTLAIE